MEHVQAIFFDFDGVLVDSVSLKRDAFESILVPVAGDRLGACMDYFMRNGGVSRLAKLQHIWTNILDRPADPSAIDRLAAEFSRRVFTWTCEAGSIPGTEAFLHRYADDIDLFVISGTPQAELQAIVEARRMRYFFKGVFGSPANKVEIGRSILAGRGYDPQRVLFIGDATTDRDAARVLGVGFVGVDGPHLRPYLDGSEQIISDLTDLTAAIESRVRL
jgi:phosphoglycolate phosphatase-like HAD superfamily hydrolase